MDPETQAELEEIFHAAPKVPAAVREKHKALVDERTGFKAWYDAAKKEDASDPNGYRLDVDLDEFNKRNDALKAKNDEFAAAMAQVMAMHKNDRAVKFAEAAARGGRTFSFGPGKDSELGFGEIKSLSEALQTDPEFTDWLKTAGRNSSGKFELKGVDTRALLSRQGPEAIRATMTTTAGFAPPSNRGSLVVDAPARTPRVQDYIPTTVTDLQFIVWMLQTVLSTGAAAVAEGALKPETAIAYVEQTSKLEKLAVQLPLTSEVLKFNSGLAGRIDRDIIRDLRTKQEDHIIGGTGVAPQIRGFLNTAGIQVYVRLVTENNADAMYKAFMQVIDDAYAEAAVIFVNPTSWTPVALLKNVDGDYIYGSPSQAGPATIWGKEVVKTKAMPVGNGLTGDFAGYSELYLGGSIEIDIGTANDDFLRNIRRMLAEVYHLLLVTRASAFSNVQNLLAA